MPMDQKSPYSSKPEEEATSESMEEVQPSSLEE